MREIETQQFFTDNGLQNIAVNQCTVRLVIIIRQADDFFSALMGNNQI